MVGIKALLFDLDGTIVDSDLAAITYIFFGGEKYLRGLHRFEDGLTTFDPFALEVAKSLEGVRAKDIEYLVLDNYENHLCEGVRGCVERLKSMVKVGILTKNFWNYTKPIARELGIDYVECSHFDINDDGKLTGRVEYICDKEGGAKRLSIRMGVKLDEIVYVSDDERVLENVGACFILDSSKMKDINRIGGKNYFQIESIRDVPLYVTKL